MTTLLRASPKGFVSTPAVERIALRALRYLQSGFSIHLRGPAGTGKTTLAMHLADLLGRPIALVFGDDQLKSSDLIGNQLGYTRKKVVDNFIHSVVKVEDELRQNWTDSRLTVACREGFTLIYDEFNRSRPEVNNILLSALEEKLIVLPPNGNRSEYMRVHPQFRAIFTSNPEEYCGVHGTQDALLDRLVTLNIPEPDELTQSQILVQKIGIDLERALRIVEIVKAFRARAQVEKSSGLRACITLAKVCHDRAIPVRADNDEFRDMCGDLLLSRTNLELEKATKLLWEVFEDMSSEEPVSVEEKAAFSSIPQTISQQDKEVETEANQSIAVLPPLDEVAYEPEIYAFLVQSQGAKVSEIEAALKINRVQTIDALRSLLKKGVLKQRADRIFVEQRDNKL